MSPGPLQVVFPRRFTTGELAEMRTMAEREDDNIDATVALGKCLDEIEKLYAEAVAQVMVDAPIPKVSDLLMESQFPLRPTIMKVIAKRLDPAVRKDPWIGAAAKSLHTVMGKSEEEVRRHLDAVTR